MKILGIECFGKSVGCAVFEDNDLLYSKVVNDGKTHSQTLMPLIVEVLQKSNTDISDIDLFGISAGPGSFTGLRIGISSVKGMAFQKNIPCVGLSSLEVMAETVKDEAKIIVPMIDARVGRVYSSIFENSEGKLYRLSDDKIWEIKNLKNKTDEYKDEVYFICDNPDLCYNILDIKKACETVCRLSFREFQKGNFVMPGDLLPIYLSRPQAERERRALK